MRGTTRCWTRTKFRRDEKAEQVLVRRMFDILEYFAPRYYWIENPGASRLKGFLDVFRPQLKSVVGGRLLYVLAVAVPQAHTVLAHTVLGL
jgi:hypothetical protein